MAAIADITVYDGAATPVLHTIKAISVRSEKGVTEAHWREGLASVPTEAQVNVHLRLRELPTRVVQVEARVNVPVMETVSGQNAAGYTAAPKVAYVDSYVLSGFQHPRSSETSRTLARQIMANLLGNVTTSVAPVKTGPLPLAFDAQIMPT